MPRLPGHAKALMAERLAGRHPPHVRLMFGPGIPRHRGESIVAIVAREYQPGLFSFDCVAGLLVTITDWTDGAGDELTLKLLALLTEVDRAGAYPTLQTPRSIIAPRRSRWALDSSDRFPLDSVSVSDLNYFLAPPAFRMAPRL
jgi:hypothetical protein